jgi:hypothetical protein
METRMSVVVVVRNKQGEPMDVTDFSAWRRAMGGGPVGFVITTPAAEEVFVNTCKMMARLPPGRYDGEMVRRVKMPRKLEKELTGHDVWKCV